MAVPYLSRQNMLKKHFIFQQICKQFDTISFNTWLFFPRINITMKLQGNLT